MNPLQDYANKKGLGVCALAAELELSAGHVCDILNGNKQIGIKTARALARLTGKPWHKYLSEAQNP